MTQPQACITSFYNSAPRAIDELRRQMGFFIENGAQTFAAYPVEYLTYQALDVFKTLSEKRLYLMITGARARSLKIKTDERAIVVDASTLSMEDIVALANPVSPVAPSAITPVKDDHLFAYFDALILAKHASLLPALLVFECTDTAREKLAPWINYRLTLEDLKRYVTTPMVDIMETARAKLPIEGAENTTLISYCSRHCVSTHLALVVGDISGEKAPLTRIHSSCVTGDILGSLRCDCGDQLQMALSQIVAEGKGILLYLHQEGRGIGITNKLRAYQLQEQGVDTYEANLMLGFEEDERDFSIAAAILKKLGVGSIRMLTNNPQKMKGITRLGIKIAERVGIVAEGGKHSHAYLDAKAKAGHQF